MAEGLQLESSKNNSHQVNFPRCSIGHFNGVKLSPDGKLNYVSHSLSCNTWNCPVCGPRKAKKFIQRALEGEIGCYEGQTGFRSRYEVKMVTLTCPGADYRKSDPCNTHTSCYTGNHSPWDAYVDMKRHFDKLIRAMRKTLGNFLYVCVVERHQDGYPHFHVVFAGKCMIPKSVQPYIENLWRFTYGMGFIKVSGSRKFKSVKHALNYCLKYVKKNPGKFCEPDAPTRSKTRPITSCRHALVPPLKKVPSLWLGYSVKLGSYGYEKYSTHELAFIESQHDLDSFLCDQGMLYDDWVYHTSDYEKPKVTYAKQQAELKKGYQECADFFDSIIEGYRPVQLRLF